MLKICAMAVSVISGYNYSKDTETL
jgi:hypothetical protein